MKQILISVALAVTMLAGCATGALDTPAKQGVAFCDSVAGAIDQMTLFQQTGNLSDGEILQVLMAISIIDPYCEGDTPDKPDASVVEALNILLLLQLEKEN